MAKKSKGRQRVEMVKMKNETNLQVTFSKRRAGLFKKASELCTLCAAKIAVIIFSPGKKVYCFGHPSLEMIIDRFEGRPPRPIPLSSILIENVTLHQLNAEFAQLSDLLDIESNHGQALTQSLKAGQAEKWWEVPPMEMANENIEILRHAMLELKAQVASEVQERVIEVERSVNPNTQFLVRSSSNPSSSHQGLANPDLNNAGFVMPFNAGKTSFGGGGFL